jgi:hypothetical protein
MHTYGWFFGTPHARRWDSVMPTVATTPNHVDLTDARDFEFSRTKNVCRYWDCDIAEGWMTSIDTSFAQKS